MLNLQRLGHSHRRESAGLDEAQRASGTSARPRVLIVDDDAIDRMLARAKLDALGCHAVAVGSGAAALEALAAEPFDIAFIDCRMPNIDGYETTRALRLREDRGEVAHRGRLPVVAATAGPGYRDRCEAAGMSDVLVKPYSRDELRIVLRRWFADATPKSDGRRDPGRIPSDFVHESSEERGRVGAVRRV